MEYLYEDDEGKEIIEKIKNKYELTKFQIKIENKVVSFSYSVFFNPILASLSRKPKNS